MIEILRNVWKGLKSIGDTFLTMTLTGWSGIIAFFVFLTTFWGRVYDAFWWVLEKWKELDYLLNGGSAGLRGAVNGGWPPAVAECLLYIDAFVPVVAMVTWAFILAGGWVVVAAVRIIKSCIPTVA